MKIRILKSVYDYATKILGDALDDLKFKIDDWQDTYDEREGNEPEYDSQIERWQDALDRLEEKISDLTDIVEDYESWVDELDCKLDETNGTMINAELDIETLRNLIQQFSDFNQEYRGIAPIIKNIKKAYKMLST